MQAEAFSTAKLLQKVLEEGQCESGECQSIKKIYKGIWEYCWNNMIDHEHGAWFRIRYFYIYVIISLSNWNLTGYLMYLLHLHLTLFKNSRQSAYWRFKIPGRKNRLSYNRSVLWGDKKQKEPWLLICTTPSRKKKKSSVFAILNMFDVAVEKKTSRIRRCKLQFIWYEINSNHIFISEIVRLIYKYATSNIINSINEFL